MRPSILCAVLVSAAVSAAQTSQELHSRYGEPNIERFTVRPSIGVTVEYGSDGLACQMVVEAQQPLVHREQSRRNMAPEVVDGIIDEMVPPEVRGRKVDSLYQSAGCGELHVDFYENVTISRSTDHCLPLKPQRDGSVTIVFKRQRCPSTGLRR